MQIINQNPGLSSRKPLDIEDVAALYQRGRELAAGNDLLNQWGDDINLNNMMIEYAVGEQNYERTKPSAIAAQLQALGMSRAAALEAAAGASPANTSVTSQPPSPPTIQPAVELAQTAISAAKSIFDVYNAQSRLHLDTRAANLSALGMQQHQFLTDQQYQGMQDASALMQYYANVRDSNPDAFKDMTPAQVVDTVANNPEYVNIASSDWFKRFQTNPFAFSAFHDYFGRSYDEGAKQFNVLSAAADLEQKQLGIDISINYRDNIMPLMNSIMSNQEEQERITTWVRRKIDIAKAEADVKGIEFDSAHWDHVLAHLEEWKQIWGNQIDVQLNQLRAFNDSEFYLQMKEAMMNTYAYEAQQMALMAVFSGDIQTAYDSMPADEKSKIADTYVRYNMFNQDAKIQSRLGLVFGGLRAGGSVAAGVGSALFGAKYVGAAASKANPAGLILNAPITPAFKDVMHMNRGFIIDDNVIQ